MRLWKNTHVFRHDWETVVGAAMRKYPNPYNPSILGMDVIHRQVDPDKGVLFSHRLVTSTFTELLRKVGIPYRGELHASEHTMVDPKQRVYNLISRNLELNSVVHVEEQLEYRPHPEYPEWTMLTQQAHIRGGWGFGRLEEWMAGVYEENVAKGHCAIDWVIQRSKNSDANLLDQVSAAMKQRVDGLHRDVDELSVSLLREMDELSVSVKREVDELGSSVAQVSDTVKCDAARSFEQLSSRMTLARVSVDDHVLIL